MKRLRRLGLAMAVAGALATTPGAVVADSASHSYLLVAEEANIGVASSGDTIHVTCEATEGVCGTFAVNPKSIEASGEFQHFLPDGSLFASGTWTATDLISFQPYGCGEVFGQPIPPDLCGGAVKFRATFSAPIRRVDGDDHRLLCRRSESASQHRARVYRGHDRCCARDRELQPSGRGDNIYIQTS